MQGDAEEAPLVSGPRRGEHGLREVEERSVQPGAVGQVDPNVAELLRHEEPVGAVVGVDHGHRVTQPVGHFLQAQLQTPFGVLAHQAQVSIELWGQRRGRRR